MISPIATKTNNQTDPVYCDPPLLYSVPLLPPIIQAITALPSSPILQSGFLHPFLWDENPLQIDRRLTIRNRGGVPHIQFQR